MARIALVGLGAIGAAYASRFVDAGDRVQVIADPERLERYRGTPTSVNGREYRFDVVGLERAEVADLLLVAVKYPQLAEAIELASGAVGPGTIVLSLLNGIDSEQVLAAAFPQATVLLAISAGIDAVRSGREVRFTSLGRISFGEPVNTPPHSRAVRQVADLLARAGIDHEVPADMVHTLWWKWLVNVGVNQVSAVLRAPYAAFQEDGSPARTVMLAAQREVMAVAASRGIRLGEADLARWLEVLAALGPSSYTSMAQDVIAGRPTEVEIFAGTVVALGEAAGVPTPVNATLRDLLRAIGRL